MSQHIFSFQVICGLLVFNTVVHFCTNFNLIMRWYRDHPRYGQTGPARSIQVGMQPEMPMTYDRRTGMALGLIVPEADRDVFKKPIHYSIKEAIQAIPFKDENGEEIAEGDDQIFVACGMTPGEHVYKVGVYELADMGSETA